MEIEYEYAGKLYPVSIVRDGKNFRVEVSGREYSVECQEPRENFLRLSIDGRTVKCNLASDGNMRHIFLGGNVYRFRKADADSPAPDFDEMSPRVTSPISGRITTVGASPGDAVEKGRVLMTIEAMKMEYQIKAPYDGTVAEMRFGVGDQVDIGDVLVELDRAENDD